MAKNYIQYNGEKLYLSERTKRQLLEELLKDIAEATGHITSKEEAIEKGQKHYLQLEYNSIHGGYRIVSVKVENGGCFGAFGGNGCEPRLNAKEMEIRMRSILDGIKAVSHNFHPAAC